MIAHICDHVNILSCVQKFPQWLHMPAFLSHNHLLVHQCNTWSNFVAISSFSFLKNCHHDFIVGMGIPKLWGSGKLPPKGLRPGSCLPVLHPGDIQETEVEVNKTAELAERQESTHQHGYRNGSHLGCGPRFIWQRWYPGWGLTEG